jgi:quercetin dioxygenase-like cupin family protein
MIEILKPDFEHSDERGTLTQLVSGGYTQINVIFTRKGSIRGRMHYHRENYEAFYLISGKLRLKTSENFCEFTRGDMFRIPPNVGHSFEFLDDTLLVSMYSLGVELADGTRDIIEIGE